MLKKNSKTNLPGSSKISGGRAIWGAATAAALVAAGGVFVVLDQVSDTTEYYVINQTIPARTQITPEMLVPVVTNKGGEPRNAFSPAHVSSGDVYSLFPINAGDIVASSNAGSITPINNGIPADFVVTSFTADAETSVSGRISRGSYVDIIGTRDVGDGEVTKYVLRNVYVLEVNSSLGKVNAELSEGEITPPGEGASASDTAAARSGVPAIYTVGLSQQDALILAAASNDDLKLVLSPKTYGDGQGAGTTDLSVSSNEIYSDSWVTGDSGTGTGIVEENTPSEGEASEGEASEEPASTDSETPAETDTQTETSTPTENPNE